MSVAAVAGGWIGAHIAKSLPAPVMRACVIAFGFVVAGKMLLR